MLLHVTLQIFIIKALVKFHCDDKEGIYFPIPAGYYMSLSRNSVQRAGDRAFFVSREMKSGSRPQCLSFW